MFHLDASLVIIVNVVVVGLGLVGGGHQGQGSWVQVRFLLLRLEIIQSRVVEGLERERGGLNVQMDRQGIDWRLHQRVLWRRRVEDVLVLCLKLQDEVWHANLLLGDLLLFILLIVLIVRCAVRRQVGGDLMMQT